MTECIKYQDLISCLIDGEITENEKTDLEAHIAACSSCKAYLDLCNLMSGGVDTSEPPASLAANVMRAVKNAPAPVAKRKGKKSGYQIGRWAIIAACLALAFIAVPQITGRLGMGSDLAAPAEGAHELTGFPETDAGSGAKFCEDYDSRSMSDDVNTEAYVVSPEPAPAPTSSPDEQVSIAAEGAGDTLLAQAPPPDASHLKNFEAVAEIFGELPEFLAEYTQKDNGDGTFDIIVPAALLEELKELDIEIYVNEEADCDEILIIYVP